MPTCGYPSFFKVFKKHRKRWDTEFCQEGLEVGQVRLFAWVTMSWRIYPPSLTWASDQSKVDFAAQDNMFRIGSKGDYGLRALIDLAERYEAGAAVQAKDIASRKAIPKDYLALIMVALRKAGLVESVRGPGGGYRLAHPPERITMGWALRALEGPVKLLPCTSDFGFDQCDLSPRCRMRSVWMEANRAVMAILDATTLADLCSPSPGATASLSKDHRPLSDQMPDGLIFHI